MRRLFRAIELLGGDLGATDAAGAAGAMVTPVGIGLEALLVIGPARHERDRSPPRSLRQMGWVEAR